jgi:hypothetical protein
MVYHVSKLSTTLKKTQLIEIKDKKKCAIVCVCESVEVEKERDYFTLEEEKEDPMKQ